MQKRVNAQNTPSKITGARYQPSVHVKCSTAKITKQNTSLSA